jgi:hypothetical protein
MVAWIVHLAGEGAVRVSVRDDDPHAWVVSAAATSVANNADETVPPKEETVATGGGVRRAALLLMPACCPAASDVPRNSTEISAPMMAVSAR